jgi:hypothetical protein
MYEGIFAMALRSYTMQNGKGEGLFRGAEEEYFWESGNKTERWVSKQPKLWRDIYSWARTLEGQYVESHLLAERSASGGKTFLRSDSPG